MYIGFQGTGRLNAVFREQQNTKYPQQENRAGEMCKKVQKNHTGADRFEVNELFFFLSEI